MLLSKQAELEAMKIANKAKIVYKEEDFFAIASELLDLANHFLADQEV